MARIPLPGPDELDADQRKVFEEVLAGPRGQVIGPLRAVIHSPDLAQRWSRLGEFLRYATVLPKHLNELAIAVTGRRWTSQVEWWVHARMAMEAGIAPAVIEAIRDGRSPVFADPDELAVYEFSRQLLQTGRVEAAAYKLVLDRFTVRGVVELTALVGYYSMVSMTLNAHEVPLPDGAEPIAPLGPGLAELAPGRCSTGS